MAEVLGFVSAGAGLLSLSIQLQENALKLKDLCSSIRHADERLKQLIFDLETEALLLRKIDSLRQNTDRQDELLDRCIATCRRHASEVEEAATAITAQIQRSANVGKLYWAFKEHSMDKLCAKLDKAKTSLHLASAMFMHQEQELQLLANRNAMTAMTTILTHTISAVEPADRQALSGNMQLNNNTADTVDSGGAVSWGKQRRKPRWRVRFSNWFNATMWDIAVQHAEGSWSVNFRIQCYRPCDVRVYKLCKYGDIGHLQQLLTEKQISVVDKWPPLYSADKPKDLLSIAAMYGQVALCKWLLSHAEWPDHLESLSVWDKQWHHVNWVDAFRVFIEVPEADADMDVDELDRTHNLFFRNRAPKDCISVLVRNQTTLYTLRPIQERLEFGSLSALRGTAVDAYLKSIGADVSSADLAMAKSRRGWTALHQVAEAFWWPTYSQEWFGFGVELLKSGANVSALGVNHDAIRKVTPLLARLTKAGALTWPSELPDGDLAYLVRALDDWSSMLSSAGMDLLAYCERERSQWEEIRISHNDFDPTFAVVDRDYALRQHCHSFYPVRLVHEASSAGSLGLECRSCSLLQIFELQLFAGSYPKHLGVPITIIWEPRGVEEIEGPWKSISASILRGKPFDARARRREQEKQEVFLTRDRLIKSAQDDASFALLGERRSSLRSSAKQRSASVSKPRAKFQKDIWPENVLKWLPDSPQLGLWNDETHLVSAFEGRAWYYWSFLAQIKDCQEDLFREDWIFKFEPAHTPGAPQCPWGCHLVDLSKLNVPDSCWRWHPWARW